MARISRGSGKTDKHRVILQQAAVLFNKRGYNAVTMDDIANALGASKLSIYYYFKSKEDILYLINEMAQNRVLKGLKEILASDNAPEAKLRMAIKNHLNVLLSELSPDIVALRQQHSLSLANRRKLIKKRDLYDQAFRGIISEGIKQRIFRDCDPKLAHFAIIGAISHILNWYSPDGALTEEEIADFFSDFLIRSILRTPLEKHDKMARNKR